MEWIIGACVVAIAFMLIFRKQISDLFPRIKSISNSGVTLGDAQKNSSVEVDPRKEAEDLIRQLDSDLIRETENLIKIELGKKNLLGPEAVPVLLRYFAALYIEYMFLHLYRIIWGSQIALLDYLNTQDGRTVDELKIFYEIGASQYPKGYINYSYNQWLGFLKDQVLLREDNGMIRVTVRGREFLLYLTRSGLIRNTAG